MYFLRLNLERNKELESIILIGIQRRGVTLSNRLKNLIFTFSNVDLKNEKICDYMTNNPEILQSDDSIAFALNKMTDGGFRHVPIVHSISQDLYVISMQDIINSIGDFYFDDIVNLPPKPPRGSSEREGA